MPRNGPTCACTIPTWVWTNGEHSDLHGLDPKKLRHSQYSLWEGSVTFIIMHESLHSLELMDVKRDVNYPKDLLVVYKNNISSVARTGWGCWGGVGGSGGGT